MASTYTLRLRLVLQATGEGLNTWGATNNTQALALIDDAIAGVTSFTLSSTKVLSSSNGSSDEARRAVLNITSGTGGTVTIPSVSKMYLVRNATTGAVTVTTGSGLNASVPAGDSSFVFSDGSNTYLAKDYNFAGERITGIGTPTVATDGVPKSYADNVLVQANAYTDAVATASGNLPNQTGNSGKVVTTNGTTASWDTLSALGGLVASSNLSDVLSAPLARISLGLGNVATRNIGTTTGTVADGGDSRIVGAAQKASNLADLVSASSARVNLGLGTAATFSIVPIANGGTNATTAAQARTNLGLGTAAVQNSGDLLQTANNLSDLASVVAALGNIGGFAGTIGGLFASNSFSIPLNVGGSVVRLIVKLGYEAAVSTDSTRGVTFGTAFPTACIGVFPIGRRSAFNSGSGGFAELIGTPSASGCTVANKNVAGGPTIDIAYIAFGY